MSPLGSLDELAPPEKKGRALGLSDDAGPEGAASEENDKTEGGDTTGLEGQCLAAERGGGGGGGGGLLFSF
jgi:hypothetical protein